MLLINQVFHPDHQATSQYLSRLAEALVKRGHEVTVLTGRRDYDDPAKCYPARETWRGVEIIRLWSAGMGHGAKWRRAVDFLSFLVSASLRGLFLRRADVVIALTTPPLVSVLGAALAKLWQGRFIYWVMDLNPDEAVAIGWLKPDGVMTHLLDTASRWSLRQADRVIVLDEYMRERVIAKDITAGKIEVIPLWTQEQSAFNAEKRREFRKKHRLDDAYVVLYAGNHTPCHPLDTLVGAVRLLQDAPGIRFGFVGFGLDWARWRDQAREEGWTNAFFLGFQGLETGLLSAADLQVVVMGEPFVGIVHPCKVYNFLGAQRPFIYVGPERSHVPDLIREAQLGEVATAFRHGESHALAEDLRLRATRPTPAWPPGDRFTRWTESAVMEKIVALIEERR